jgi:hypothetical protein
MARHREKTRCGAKNLTILTTATQRALFVPHPRYCQTVELTVLGFYLSIYSYMLKAREG